MTEPVQKIYNSIQEALMDYAKLGVDAARRPKPLSLKEQALEALDDFSKMSETLYSSYDPPEEIYSDQVNIIRRALEALPDDL